jgi:hypothetical protein
VAEPTPGEVKSVGIAVDFLPSAAIIEEKGYAVVHPREDHPRGLRYKPLKTFATKTQGKDYIASGRNTYLFHAKGRRTLTWADRGEGDVTAFLGAFIQTGHESLKMGAESFRVFVETALDPH